MTRRRLFAWLLLAGLSACGKKGPPKRPDGSSGMKIDPAAAKKKEKPS